MADTYQFGMVGLGTMGRNLALNVADHGFSVLGLATSEEKAKAFSDLAEGRKLSAVCGPESFIAQLEKPRIVMILVPAGDPVDSVIAELSPYMEPGDFFIEGGNSHYTDTERRSKTLSEKGLGFIGVGVSGGENGARRGPSMMAGGTEASYQRVQPILEAVAAKFDGEPCVGLLGKGGAGHYVKMVHNGIEYGIMQMLAEAYDYMHRGLGMTNAAMADEFEKWNNGPFGGYLTAISMDVLRVQDPDTGNELVDMILDKAKQKGTGKWTSQDAFDLGIPIPTIDAAVSARELSGMKEERVEAEGYFSPNNFTPNASSASSPQDVSELGEALHLAMLLTYAQGISLLDAASAEHEMDIDIAQSTKVWRAGCIIRSKMLDPLYRAVKEKPEGKSVLLAPSFRELILELGYPLRAVVGKMIAKGIPAPCLGASLAYFDGYRTGRLPANFIQGLRDYFGAHTYERIDKPGSFHTHWGDQ
ncbi:MAG: phosphogluconate dehydrogenase (NADP(+)-dependent, decarboxylating) [Armatimonadetes bacterium 55-13]|nr:NADP-dependent phosphogluconate dehydrogenase [Armatimonadota bacterium]OJU65422.1 MAG: phosphogluconate dehydrogenase (NADP(+)-dependent, decarboxylating) [Armatimonadetes bacterium 55-13]